MISSIIVLSLYYNIRLNIFNIQKIYLKDIIPYRLLKDYAGIITGMLKLRCVLVKVKRSGKKVKGGREIGEKTRTPDGVVKRSREQENK